MDKKSKEERKYRVLSRIVHSYVYTVTPVSSKTVSQDMGEEISSATVRNIMAELEEEEYIEQPHTSAGRIPTSQGYRRYVETIRDHIQFKRSEAQRLTAEYDKHIRSLKEVIEKTSFLISKQLQNAGVVMWPSIDNLYLKHIELIKLKSETVLAILVTMTNAVKNYIVKLEEDLKKTELEKIVNYINTDYEHFSLSDILKKLRAKVYDISGTENKDELRNTKRSALEIIDAIFEENIENEICCNGLNYFINEPEFRNMNITKRLMQMFSEQKDIKHIMRGELPYNGIKVYIGEENGCEALKECSVITCGYNMHGRTVGRLGVIGPMRMDYNHALGTIRHLSDLISDKLEGINS